MKKIKVFALILVLAFAATGGAYAIWQDTLLVEETITTGDVNVIFERLCGSDWGCNYECWGGDVYAGHPDSPSGGLDNLDPDNPNERKNIGCLDREIRQLWPDEGDSDEGRRDLLKITLKNAYPGYQEYVDFRIRNVGTIPVKFELNLFEDLHGVVYSTNGVVENSEGWLIIEFDTIEHIAGGNNITDPFSDEIEGYQLNPKESLRINMIHRVRHNAPQGEEFEFTYKIKAIQWNAYDFSLPNSIQARNP